MSDPEGDPAILASDGEREHTVEVLQRAVVDGRLTLEEFSQRVGLAQTARTDRELALLSRDLPAAPAQGEPGSEIPEHDRHLAFCSRIDRRGPWELPSRSTYRSVFETIDLDLRQARLIGNDTSIEIYNLFGTVTLIVPEGIEVIVSGGGLFASQVIDTPTAPRIVGAPKLRILISGPGGTLYVRSRPPEPRGFARLLGKR